MAGSLLSEPEQIAARIAAPYLGSPVQTVLPIVGCGAVNLIYVVQSIDHQVIVRMRDDVTVIGEYEKEAWCLAQAKAAGIPSPMVLDVGVLDDYAYMVQTFVPGTHGKAWPGDRIILWQTLGQYARLIHQTPVTGFGNQLQDPLRCIFSNSHVPTWRNFVEYNVQSLRPDDALMELGIYSRMEQPAIRQRFVSLRDHDFCFGLSHGDLALRNLLVDDCGKITLLDWGTAQVRPVPHHDLMEILRWYHPSDDHLKAFLDGYGMLTAEFLEIQPLMQILDLLQVFDLVRWALDKNPQNIAEYATRAQEARQQLLLP